MLIEVMKFEIHDFTTHVSEEFVVTNTIDNQEMVFTHPQTRNITFDRIFDFEFDRVMRMPIEMVTVETWTRMVAEYPELVEQFSELEAFVEA